MKNMVKRFTAMVMSILMICACGITASAITPASEVEEEDPVIASRAAIMQDRYDEGLGKMLYLVHSLTSAETYSLLLSSSKTITKGSLPSAAVHIYASGTLTHTGFDYGDPDEIRTGLAYYMASSDSYYPEYYEFVESGVPFVIHLRSVAGLNNNITYYPFVKNMSGDYGYVYGSVGFYYTTS